MSASADRAAGAADVRFRIPPFPWPARLGLGAWALATRLGLGQPALDEESLIRAARRRTGLQHFGDGGFRLPMRRLLYSLQEEASLHLLGRSVMRSSIVRALACRLRLEHLCDLHSGIAAAPVEAPVFIAGLQRTGTTKLHRLLACDPRLRHLTAAEGLEPAPLGRPIRDEPGERARRLAMAKRAERGMRYMSPTLFAIHPIEADAPEEDVFLLDVAFVSGAIDASLEVPSYSRFIRETDQRFAYRTFRRLIQLLLWQTPGRYLGKTPHHLENLDSLFAVFQDARVIQTHRDPRRVVPSFSSMMAHAGAMLTHEIDAKRVGRRIANQAVRSVEKSMADRERLPDGAILDVHYADLMRDPMGEIERVYAFLGMELEPGVVKAMEAWMRGNPRHKNGPHRYSLAEFGLDAEELAARFKSYRERFGVEEEEA
ncbi:MAG: sulfotransferase [Deltaproteobacteria bacterium]|jgi:hypothetical protein|nr:sulfotransferase [Deltaproteobacteria bacterium]